MLALVFRSTLWHFVYVWSTDPNYSHGFLVPLISLYFANSAARLGPVKEVPAVGLGVFLLTVALLGRLATIVVPVGFASDLSFLAGLAGILALFAGRAALYRYGFALTFLVFMVPLPIHLYTSIATPLQLLVSKVAATILNGTGLPVLCEGNHLTLPGGVQMFVAEACSGMRQLTGFLALTTAVAFLTPRPRWYRAVLIGSAIPVALTANVARVVLTGWIMANDPRLAQGAFHTLEGLLLMGFGLALLRLECAVLNVLVDEEPEGPEPVPTAA
jgi:exosortase